MMRFDLKELLRDADLRGYAVPAFNFSDGWELRAIMEVAAELHAPVIAASNMQVVSVHGAQLLGQWSTYFIERAQTPLVFHLDHSNDPELCKLLIDCGYPSVMFDGSMLPMEENIAATAQVAAYAAAHGGACVEAEVGRIRGRNEESQYSGDSFLASVEGAVQLVEGGKCDSLAVGLGNAHGFYTERPKLHFDRLEQINAAVSTPLVLHGGTGIPEEDIQRAIRGGINKVNVGTQLHYTYLKALQDYLKADDFKPNVLNAMLPVVEAIKEPVRKWIKVCMADRKA